MFVKFNNFNCCQVKLAATIIMCAVVLNENEIEDEVIIKRSLKTLKQIETDRNEWKVTNIKIAETGERSF